MMPKNNGSANLMPMASVEQDRRLPWIVILILTASSVAVAVCVSNYGLVADISVIAAALLACGFFRLWLYHFYRCPSCHRRLAVMPRTRLNRFIRYHCSDCGVTWVGGLTADSAEDTIVKP